MILTDDLHGCICDVDLRAAWGCEVNKDTLALIKFAVSCAACIGFVIGWIAWRMI